jgi:ribonuclease P/MRP protein subunit POP5
MTTPKHCRPRWRYLAIELQAWPDADLSRRGFQGACWTAARDLLGDVGSAAIDCTVVRFSFADGAGHAIVRVAHDETERGRAVLACVDAVDGAPVGLRIRGTSGTIRACEEKYLPATTEPIEETTVAFDGADRTAYRRGNVCDVRCSGGFVGATARDH